MFHNDKGASNELKEEDGTVGDVVAAGVAVVCTLYTSQENSRERVIECNNEQHEIRNAWS